MDPRPEKSLADLAKICRHDSQRWFPQSDNLPHHALSLCGEAGELANIIKKIDRGSLDISDPAVSRSLALEATDVLVYLLNVFAHIHVDPYKAFEHVRRENERRFGGKNA